MPIHLDPTLPEPLYPVAWLIGSWRGHGAVQLREEDGTVTERRIEQQLEVSAREDATIAWSMRTEMIDAPAPLPPTSAFARDDAERTAPVGSGERTLLMRESGTWRIGEPLPGQDLEAARAAAPGDPAGVLSYAVSAQIAADGDDGVTALGSESASESAGEEAGAEWAGEVRGPRILLARRASDGAAGAQGTTAGTVLETRMFGYVAGRLMWLWERRPVGSPTEELAPYLSVEMDRA